MGFDGSCIEGFSAGAGVGHAGLSRRLPRSRCCPGVPESNAVARMFCDDPHAGRASRSRAIRAMCWSAGGAPRRRGWATSFNVGPELEYFYFKDARGHRGARPRRLLRPDVRSTPPPTCAATRCSRWRRWAFPWSTPTTRTGPSQHEIDLRFADALSMADAVMTYKLVVKEIAHEARRVRLVHAQAHGGRAGQAACTCTRACSIARRQQRVLRCGRPVQGYNLSAVAKRYIAGLLKYAPEFCAGHEPVRELLQAPRLPGGEAPTYLSLGARATARRSVRIPGLPARPARTACRVELRSPDPAANPYLAFAVMLAAGLAGIEEGLELHAPADRGPRPVRAARATSLAPPGHRDASREPSARPWSCSPESAS